MQNDALDLDAIAAAIDGSTRIVFLANPNNPTGTMFNVSALDRFLDRVPEQVTIVVDEAYYDYASYFAERRGVRDHPLSPDDLRVGENPHPRHREP